MEYIVVISTFPHKEEAQAVGRTLLEGKLVACVNCVDGVASHFWWQGAIDSADEVLLIAKTRADYFDRIASTIKKHHSYEVPEIIALPISNGHKDYLQWIDASLA